MEAGRKKGLAEGRAEGKKEEKKIMAKKMKEENIPLEIIVKVTELSKEEIEKL